MKKNKYIDGKTFVDKLLHAQYSMEYNEVKQSVFSKNLQASSGLYYTIKIGAEFLEDSVYVILNSSGFAAQT